MGTVRVVVGKIHRMSLDAADNTSDDTLKHRYRTFRDSNTFRHHAAVVQNEVYDIADAAVAAAAAAVVAAISIEYDVAFVVFGKRSVPYRGCIARHQQSSARSDLNTHRYRWNC